MVSNVGQDNKHDMQRTLHTNVLDNAGDKDLVVVRIMELIPEHHRVPYRYSFSTEDEVLTSLADIVTYGMYAWDTCSMTLVMEAGYTAGVPPVPVDLSLSAM